MTTHAPLIGEPQARRPFPATSCPPPRHNFYRIPRIRSEHPAFDLHYPHVPRGRATATGAGTLQIQTDRTASTGQ